MEPWSHQDGNLTPARAQSTMIPTQHTRIAGVVPERGALADGEKWIADRGYSGIAVAEVAGIPL